MLEIPEAPYTIGDKITTSIGEFIFDGIGFIPVPQPVGSASAAGNETEIQFNDNGVFGASSGLTWNKTGNILHVGGEVRPTSVRLNIDNKLLFDGSDNDTFSIHSDSQSTLEELHIGIINNPSITIDENKLVSLFGGVNINNEYRLPTTDGTSGQLLATNGAGQLSFIAPPTGTASAAGNATEIQFRGDTAGEFDASPNFTWDNGTAKLLTVNGTLNVNNANISADLKLSGITSSAKNHLLTFDSTTKKVYYTDNPYKQFTNGDNINGSAWYRIAYATYLDTEQVGNPHNGHIYLSWGKSTTFYGNCVLQPLISYAGREANINVIGYTVHQWTNNSIYYGVTKARLVHDSTFNGGSHAYLEVYIDYELSAHQLYIYSFDTTLWTLIDVQSGSIPSGYEVTEIMLRPGIGTNKLLYCNSLKSETSIQIGDDTSTASEDSEGKLRYRRDSNNSYFEICMKTSTSTYTWVNIAQNTW